MPSPGFDIRIKDGYHRSEVSLFERAIHSGETVRFYMSQEKADRLPDFLEVTSVDVGLEKVLADAVQAAEVGDLAAAEQAAIIAAESVLQAQVLAEAERAEAEKKEAIDAEKAQE